MNTQKRIKKYAILSFVILCLVLIIIKLFYTENANNYNAYNKESKHIMNGQAIGNDTQSQSDEINSTEQLRVLNDTQITVPTLDIQNTELPQENSDSVVKKDNEADQINKTDEAVQANEIDEALQFNEIDKADNTFSRIVLTVGQNPTKEVNISFEADYSIKGCKVRVGKKGVDMQFPTDYKEYEANRTEVETTLRGEQTMYSAFSVKIDGLEPNTEYLYILGSNTNWTIPRAFTTLNEHSKITLGFFGDIQGYKQAQYDNFRKTLEKVDEVSEGLDLIMLAGDIVDSANLHEEWQYLDHAVGDYLASNLIVATPGNHDVKGGDHIYASTFVSPDNGSGNTSRNYFTEIADCIIAVIDTEKPETFEEQKEWLAGIMQGHENDFKIVLMHRSVYPISYNELNIREFARIFDECKIDLVLSGHDHIYSRTTMLNNIQVKIDDGTTYVVGGSASGSKYYNHKDIEGGRYWENVIYDDNFPVFSLLSIENKQLKFNVYTIIDNEIIEIDSFEIVNY